MYLFELNHNILQSWSWWPFYFRNIWYILARGSASIMTKKRKSDMIESKDTDPWDRRRTSGVSFIHLNFHDMNPSTCIPCNWFVKKLSTLRLRAMWRKNRYPVELVKPSRRKRTTYKRGKKEMSPVYAWTHSSPLKCVCAYIFWIKERQEPLRQAYLKSSAKKIQ